MTGGKSTARRFFKIRNLTRRVRAVAAQTDIPATVGVHRSRDATSAEHRSGSHCTDPVTCEFFDHCNPPRPHDHIGFLPRLHASAMEELEEMGVESIRDIPDDFELSEIQRRAATCVQTGEPWFSPELRDVLDGLTYPLYFADFETVNRAIPPFAGMRPYDHLPFQWSVHVQRQPGAEPEHHEFLATDANDPRREFISSLCAALGERGSIVVYSSFESQRLSELGSWFPEFADRINAIQARLFDLLPSRAGARLPSGIRRLVLDQIGLARARAGYDLRRHGGRERAGCRAGMGVACAWRLGSWRARENQEGSAGLLRARHTCDGRVTEKTQARKIGTRSNRLPIHSSKVSLRQQVPAGHRKPLPFRRNHDPLPPSQLHSR